MKNWVKDLAPLLEKYGKMKHPLEYKNRYQLLVMIILAAQSSDNQINRMAPEFFKKYPSISDLKDKSPDDLYPLVSSVRGFRKKAKWIVDAAKVIGDDKNIPTSLAELSKLPGIGRKTANVIIRESGGKAEGVMVDLHVIRVAPRLGIVTTDKPEKIEKQLMEIFPQDTWNDLGMSLSFQGREICRPKPKCDECIVNSVCNYYKTVVKAQGSGNRAKGARNEAQGSGRRAQGEKKEAEGSKSRATRGRKRQGVRSE
jgi:endonuclease III